MGTKADMKKKGEIILRCQCCRDYVRSGSYKYLIQGNAHIQAAFPYVSLIEMAKQGPCCMRWACDDCLRDKVALPAVIQRQNLSPCHPEPNVAYFDEIKQCKICKQTFLFSKEEQRHWYEELKFRSWSKCITCKSCRKSRRYINSRNAALSKLIPEFEAGKISHLDRIVELYTELGNKEAAKRILASASKKCAKDEKYLEHIKQLRNQL